MGRTKILACVVAGVLPMAAPVHLFFSPPDPVELSSAVPAGAPAERRQRAERARAERSTIDVYRGLGAWVDAYNRAPWRYPEGAVRKMRAHGVRTLYLQTGNHRLRRDLYRAPRLARFVQAAHRHGIDVVAWYAPSFADPAEDRRRALAALRFETRSGDRFDSFALDIEVPMVHDVDTRNRRLRSLADAVRRVAGPRYPLGAIVPEAGASYWPRFPYRMVARRFDVFLPMAYYSYRTSGAAGVASFITRNIETIRRWAGRVPVHVIGGIAGRSSATEVAAFVDAVNRARVFGASLYDFPITTPTEWRAMRALRFR